MPLNRITADAIADGTVIAADIADNTITAAKLVSGLLPSAAANSAASYANSAFTKANTDVTGITISAGVYGNATVYPTITLAANGRVTAVGTASAASPAGSNTFGFKNRIINGGYIINQRAYVSGTALSVGTYAHDRWKAGSGGCTYTFTQPATGVNATITITAGTLQQVIEGCNMPEGGTYVLSWTGTAQARFNSGSYGASPLSVTSITAGADVTIEFNTGTVNSVQVESGSSVTSYDYRNFGNELIMCQRYYEVIDSFVNAYLSYKMGGPVFKVKKRAVPTAIFIGAGGAAGFMIEQLTSGNNFPVTAFSATVDCLTNITITYGTNTLMGGLINVAAEL